MPIYEYRCQECQHELDALQRVDEPPLSDCPECGEPALRKLISAPGFRLKGSGWYETDFKTGNKKNLAGEKEPKKAGDAGAGKNGKAGKEDKPSSGAKTAAKPAGGSPAGGARSANGGSSKSS